MTKEPTATETGIKTFTCNVCEEIKTEEIPKLDAPTPSSCDHVWGDEKDEVTPATCTGKGSVVVTHKCTECGFEGTVRNEEIPVTGHTMGEWEIMETKAATCVAAGFTHERSVCAKCGHEEFRDSSIKPSDNHIWDDGVITRAPTKTEVGIRTYTCTLCKITKTEEIPMLDSEGAGETDLEKPIPDPVTPAAPAPAAPAPAAPAPAAPAAVAPAAVAPAPAPAALAPEEEELPEDETPLAPPEENPADPGTPTAAPETVPAEESLDEGETPLAAPGSGSWAVLNLVLALCTVLAGILTLVLMAANRKGHGILCLASLVPALGALVAFMLTEDMRLSMVLVDRWTLLMVLIALVQLTVCVLAGTKQSGSNNEPGGPTAARA